MKKNYFEFSKVVVRRALVIFLVQMLATIAIIFFRPESSVQLIPLMNATIPLYIVIFGGYFGKAGLENYNKIKYDTQEYQPPIEASLEQFPEELTQEEQV